jgi:hypothetical protein
MIQGPLTGAFLIAASAGLIAFFWPRHGRPKFYDRWPFFRDMVPLGALSGFAVGVMMLVAPLLSRQLSQAIFIALLGGSSFANWVGRGKLGNDNLRKTAVANEKLSDLPYFPYPRDLATRFGFMVGDIVSGVIIIGIAVIALKATLHF